MFGPIGLGTTIALLEARTERTVVALRKVNVHVPDIVTCCGLPALLSVMEIPALKGPKIVGVTLTVMVQDDPAATLVLQVFV